MKKLIIARHGNTFRKGDTVTRIGAGTDLPLVEEEKGCNIGKYLLMHGIIPTKIIAAPLKRTMQTAELIRNEMHLDLKIVSNSNFTEIDYGIDENKTEDQIIERLGREHYSHEGIIEHSLEDVIIKGGEILEKWNRYATIPNGWIIDKKAIIESWKELVSNILPNETVLIVTSNGIIRFAPYILAQDYKTFCNSYELKVKTGSISMFVNDDKNWLCQMWNSVP
jgi:probable phosphoglycerate mutase